MINKKINTIKLGAFITAGLLFLIVMLYMIGRDQNLFNANITLRARFSNANGLVPGNNVRYAGIQVGTVKKVKLINDTVIEVVMLIDQKYKPNIHRNSLAAIRTEGFIGNKIVNIMPGNGNAAEVEDVTQEAFIKVDVKLDGIRATSEKDVSGLTLGSLVIRTDLTEDTPGRWSGPSRFALDQLEATDDSGQTVAKIGNITLDATISDVLLANVATLNREPSPAAAGAPGAAGRATPLRAALAAAQRSVRVLTTT